MMEPYKRPGIDDRPDYEKALSAEDKASVSRLAADPHRIAPESSVEQPTAQAARLATEGTASVVAAARIDAAVPDYASSFLDMRDPMVAADGERPDAVQLSHLKWGFAVGSFLAAAPWAAVNLVGLPNQIARGAGFDMGLADPAAALRAGSLAPVLSAMIILGAAWSLLFTPLVAALSDRTRIPAGRRTPWLVAGGVLSALSALALGATTATVPIVILWTILQFTYAMLVAPLAAAVAERVPDKFRDETERWNAIGVIAGQAAGGVVGGLAIGFGAFNPFLCAAVMFAVSGAAAVLVWPREPSSAEQPRVRFSWRDVLDAASLRLPRGTAAATADVARFRRLFLSRVFMTAASAATGVYLWYVVRFAVYGDDPALTAAPMTLPAGVLVALLALATFAGTLLATTSAGAVTDKFAEGFGPWWRGSHVAVVCACVLYAIGLLAGLAIVTIGGERSLMVFSFVAGYAGGLYDVLVQPLVVDALPDPHEAGRYLRAYANAKPLGLALGAGLGSGAVAVAPASFGYMAVFPAAIACVLLAALFLRR
ncbi:MFS transporter [Bifidobacterium stellenboschense]|uniref:Transport protein n=1 Tax=Bifidobacterium stellenboschense TaxID=762211 RepID=A0A087DJP3_9BIFI|nr:MFS transporter [Bifidobacterium stellenboschense]KFI95743.1 transport protein [Bifidobacterium stellenboschense]